MVKTYILDTNVLLYDPNSIKMFEDNNICIPMVVLEELDNFKKNTNELGINAREIIRTLDKMRVSGKLSDGIELEGGGKLFVTPSPITSLEKPDNKLLEIVSSVRERCDSGNVVLVTKDINLRVKADVMGVDAQDYKRALEGNGTSYYGFKEVLCTKETVDSIYEEGSIPAEAEYELLENQYVILKSEEGEKGSALGRYNAGKINILKQKQRAVSIFPKNLRQRFAMDALLDPDIKLVSLNGNSGTGKTLLAVSAGLQQMLLDKKYDSITVTRPIVPVGREIGFLPGDMDAKITPWMHPIYDALDFIVESDKKRGKTELPNNISLGDIIQIAPLNIIRGRSFYNSYMIVDECLTKNHTVWTSDGKSIPIQDLTNGQEVISYDKDSNSFNSNKISNFFSRKTQKLVKIKTTNGHFESTPTHNWWVYENGIELKKKKAEDLTEKDLLVISDNMPHHVKNKLTTEEASSLALILTDGHNLISEKKSDEMRVPEVIWNAPYESVAEFLRICFDAEGDVNYDENKNNLVINFSSMSEVFAKQIKALLSKFEIKSNYFSSKGEEHGDVSRISIIDFEAVKFLKKIGFSIKRKQEMLEKISGNNNYSENKLYPLRVFYDIKNKIMQSNEWKKLDLDVSDLNQFLGYKITPERELKTIGKNIYNRIISLSKRLNIEIREYPQVASINEIEMLSLEIPIDVFDFTVENDHTFVVDGVVSSNCQNLSPLEVKTLVTRAGHFTKIVLTGDIHQIDNPYLNDHSNGLSQLVMKFKGKGMYAHVTLKEGERSDLAEMAANIL